MFPQLSTQSTPGYSMPAASPLYPPPPYEYRGNRIVTVSFRTDPQALATLVPEPLHLIPNEPIGLYVGVLTVVAPIHLTYSEVGITIPVMRGETLGVYVPYMYLDSSPAIAAGREIWGFPKKEAEIGLSEEGGAISAIVRRNGSLLMKAAVQVGPKVEPIPETPDVPWFNLKIIPSVKRGARPDVQQLTSTVMTSHTTELRQGPATLELASSELDPLGDIPVVEVVGGQWTVSDMILDCGDVAVDYLAQR
jgi:acetoacetate decarboxylase